MSSETNRNEEIRIRKEAIWKVKVRMFDPSMIFHRVLPVPGKSWIFKIVLN